MAMVGFEDAESGAATSPDAEAVGRAITLFLERLLADDSLARSFDGMDPERVHRHTRAFVIAALGGPDLYAGRDLRVVHAPLRLSDENFDAAVDHLVVSLRAVGLADGLTVALAARLEPLRRQIVASQP
jgi:hemoglobin